MRIRQKLLINSMIVAICLISVGGVGFFSTYHVTSTFTSLIEMRREILKHFEKLENAIWKTWSSLIIHTSISDVNTMYQLDKEILSFNEQINKQFKELSAHQKIYFEQLNTFQEQWRQFQEISRTVLRLSHDFTKEDALKLVVGDGQTKFNQIIELFDNLKSERRDKMDELFENSHKKHRWLATFLIILTVLVGGGILWVMNRTSRNLLTPLSQINEFLQLLAKGQLNKNEITYGGSDEIKEIIIASHRLKNAIASTIAQTQAIVAGDYTRDITLLSSRDELGQALVEMTRTLREVTAKNALQDWLKTGQTQLNEYMSGEQDTKTLAKSIITFLSKYLGARVGLLYLLQDKRLYLTASYAYTCREDLPLEFALGEGLVGEVALERKILKCVQTPEESVAVTQSGLTKTSLRHILFAPILYEENIKGIIELGSTTALAGTQEEFLTQVLPSIGIAINTAESRNKMRVLLQQSQEQTAILTEQKGRLQTQTEELQSQAEELQTQQEELRQTNEELERRTRDLEKQRAEIHNKNINLEKAQRAVEVKAQELALASRYKSEFLANMSHELRTPLNSLLILAQLLAENKQGNLSEKQVEYAHTIHSAGIDLLTLINEILDLSKVEAGKIEVQAETVLLTDLVKMVEQKFQPLATEKGITFEISMANDVPATLTTDAQRLKQIINNLLSNAFKFTSQGNITLSVQRPHKEIDTLKLKSNDSIAFSVSDTGIGIPKDKQQVIFEAFQQADGTTSRRFGGTGLGLSISRQLARLLGGDITLTSEENQGSTFTLYLPEQLNKVITLKNETVRPKTTSKSSSSPVSDDRERLQPGEKVILIIEDDPHFSTLLRELAQEKNYKSIIANDGKEGLQLASQYAPTAIILDVSLPKVDGLTVMEMLKDDPNTRHIPVHFISGTDVNIDARKKGAIGCLLKPVNRDELLNAFQKINQFVDKSLKRLLALLSHEQYEEEILSLIKGENVDTTVVTKKVEAWQHLHQAEFDCIVLDINADEGTAITFLEQLREEEKFVDIPVILYAERGLSVEEETILQHCSHNLVVKTVRSPARLLDEVTLFLHQVEAKLPSEKQEMLQLVHDKESVLSGKKVLIVDDDTRNVFALTTILEDKEIEVVARTNGKKALEFLEKHPDIDLILMDIMMPEMDGYEAIQKIRAQGRFRKLPIIALTAKAMKGDKAKCIEVGANDYLAKPVDTDKLISMLRVWLYQ